ncbi:MAG: hypothetical protein NTZ33_15415 [Bacteroidetes bacterium]|nr:hypothetical protein [Bacteroidota bacterium]
MKLNHYISNFITTECRFGFNGKEKDDEVKGNNNSYDLGARIYDPRIGKMLSPDPKEIEYPWQTTYAYYGNSPISQLDFNGEGDYYNKNGKHLGSDGKTVTVGEGKDAKQVPDDKVYTADEKNKDGTFSNVVDLNITHTQFLNKAATVYGESSHTSDEEAWAIASVHENHPEKAAYRANNSEAKKFKKATPEKRNGTFMQVCNAGVINALNGGFDYSNGADAWDGIDQAIIRGNECSENGSESHAATIGWTIKKTLFDKWKTNVEKINGKGTFVAPQHNRAWNYKGYKNVNLMRYNATAVHGPTIFWKTRAPKNASTETN